MTRRMTQWMLKVSLLAGWALAGEVGAVTPARASDAAAKLPVSVPSAEASGSNVPGVQHSVIYRKDGIYACFPTLTVLADGRLMTQFGTRTRASHIDYTGGDAVMVSDDGGRSWKPTEEPIVEPRWRTKDGTALVTAFADGWLFAPADQRERLVREGRTVNEVRPGVVGYLGDAFSQISRDEGKTWEKHPIRLPETLSGLMNLYHDTSEVVTRAGVRLVAVYGPPKDATKKMEKHEVFILRSADDGETWTCIPMTPDGSPDPQVGYNETSLIELPNGDVLAMIRIDPTGSRHLYRSVSTDGGLTWSTPEKTEIWGYPCDLLVLHDGRLLCIYGYRKEPRGIRARLSRDGGNTWDVENELILRADGKGGPGDLGYPVVTQLPDGMLFTIYYFTTDDGVTHIAGTHFRVPKAKQ